MIKVIIQGNWAPYVGTHYCEALGIYPSLDAARHDADNRAWETWEGQDEEESGIEDGGPDYWTEEYDPEKHDMLRGGGTFEDDFSRM